MHWGAMNDMLPKKAILVVNAGSGEFVQYSPAMGGDVCDYLLVVTLYVPAVALAPNQETLDDYLAPSGSGSIAAAINSGGTLGGVVSSATCLVARDYRDETFDSQKVLAVDFPVLVRT